MDLFDIAEKVRERRKELGLSQARLAERCRLSRPRINLLESGRLFDMKFGNVVAILEALNLSLRVSEAPDSRPTFEEIRRESENDAPRVGH